MAIYIYIICIVEGKVKINIPMILQYYEKDSIFENKRSIMLLF